LGKIIFRIFLPDMIKKIVLVLNLLSFLFVNTPSALAANSDNSASSSAASGFNLAQVGDNLASSFSVLLTGNNPVHLENTQENFKASEVPKFSLNLPDKNADNINKAEKGKWAKSEQIEAKLIPLVPEDEAKREILAMVKKTASGKFELTPDMTKTLSAGKYTLEVSAKESFIYTRNISQDFTWGVLAINTSKSIYHPNEKATLYMGVLSDFGNTICDAKLDLVITDPQNQKTHLSTDSKTIGFSTCKADAYSEYPDYLTHFQTKGVGKYWMNLTAETKNGAKTITDFFEVRDNIPFDVERTTFPTRVQPATPYPVKLTITPNQDYKGQVQDFVPKAFHITEIAQSMAQNSPQPTTKTSKSPASSKTLNPPNSLILPSGTYNDQSQNYNTKETLDKTPEPITWNVDWKKGQSYNLSYTIKFPEISPEYFLMGPLKIGSFSEIRQWQVANDAENQFTCTFSGASGGSWGTAGNWSNCNSTFPQENGSSCNDSGPGDCYWVDIEGKTVILDGTTNMTVSGLLVGDSTNSSGLTINSTATLTISNAGITPLSTNFIKGSLVIGGASTSGILNLNPSGATNCLTINPSANHTFVTSNGAISSNSTNCTFINGPRTLTNAGTITGYVLPGGINTGNSLTNTGTINMSGGNLVTANSTITCNNATRANNSFYNVNVTDNSGTTTFIGSCVIKGVLTFTNSQLVTGTGTIEFSGSGTPISNGGTFIASSGGTILFSGTSATNIFSTTYDTLKLQSTSGSPTYTLPASLTTNADLIIGDGSNAVTINASSSNSSETVKGNLTVNDNVTWTKGTGTLTLQPTGTKTWTGGTTAVDIGNVSLSGGASTPKINLSGSAGASNLTIAGSHTLSDNGSGDITVTGNWSNSGSFTGTGGTVTLNGGTTATVTGANTFNNLTITHTTAKEVDFSTTGADIQTVNGLFSVTGSPDNLISLFSNSQNTKWHLKPLGTASVDYANVRDGGCETGAITINATHSTDSLNNDSCWSISTGVNGQNKIDINGGTTILGGSSISNNP
jgi:hypothetical protein